MKLFLLSDIHGSYSDCTSALDKFEKSSADYLVILGDILYHGPRNPLPKDYAPDLVFENLNKYTDKIIAVRGNCDAEVDQMVLHFNISNDYDFLALKDRLVYLSHGHIYSPENLPPGFNSDDVFAFGHIHLPIAEKVNDYYLANPGSCSMPKDGYPKSYGIIDDHGIYIFDFTDKLIKSIEFQDRRFSH